jgi:hypothetical protein
MTLQKLLRDYKELRDIVKDPNYSVIEFAVDQIRDRIKNPVLKILFNTVFPVINRKSFLYNLGLHKFRTVYIQKFINIPFPIYLLTVNSRVPSSVYLLNEIKNYRAVQFRRMVSNNSKIVSNIPKLSPPKKLDKDSELSIPSGALILIRDIGVERFVDTKMFMKPIIGK